MPPPPPSPTCCQEPYAWALPIHPPPLSPTRSQLLDYKKYEVRALTHTPPPRPLPHTQPPLLAGLDLSIQQAPPLAHAPAGRT